MEPARTGDECPVEGCEQIIKSNWGRVQHLKAKHPGYILPPESPHHFPDTLADANVDSDDVNQETDDVDQGDGIPRTPLHQERLNSLRRLSSETSL